MRPLGAAIAAAAVLLVFAGCTAVGTDPADTASVTLPPEGGAPDYQLGGAYVPSPSVAIVVRDRSDAPADGTYSICYINGFQTQPGERDAWPSALVLHDADGQEMFDPVWPDEALLNTSTAQQRDAIGKVIAPWITACAESGFDAVEFDNLDSFTRSDGALTLADNAALATRLVTLAHDAGLSAAQKNTAEHSSSLHDEAGFDIAISEGCGQFGECGLYKEVYGSRAIDIEYSDELDVPFATVCSDPDSPASMVLRDRALSTPDDDGFVFALCPASG